jgi:hypothetical protein
MVEVWAVPRSLAATKRILQINWSCFLFLWLLRCFTSPGSLPTPIYSAQNNTAFPVLGFPIRKSPDQRLFATFPRLIAGYYVLHRHFLSRHPPYALRVFYNHLIRTFLFFEMLLYIFFFKTLLLIVYT